MVASKRLSLRDNKTNQGMAMTKWEAVRESLSLRFRENSGKTPIDLSKINHLA
jgi:hypothetical protein